MIRRPPRSTLLPSTTLFRSRAEVAAGQVRPADRAAEEHVPRQRDRLPVRGGRRYEHRAPRVARCRGERQPRSEEHTSELQSRQYLVCRLLLEKKTTTANTQW